ADALSFLTVEQKDESDLDAHEWASKRYVWVPDEKEGFLLGSIVKDLSQDTVTVRIVQTGKESTMSTMDLQSVNPPKFEKVEDMSSLTCLNEASILHNLRQRYFSSLIYTYSGLFCVVINPYKRMNMIYNESVMAKYGHMKRHEVPPHIYAVADSAYRKMLHEREDQSVLCTGESGAGKTENTKKVIQYLVYTAGDPRQKTSGKSHLEDQLLQANPILEAFGNSKTIKNDNSSRFGKFIRINFDGSGVISGANIEYYLLEKSRVIRQAPQERTFHIFYQILTGSTDEQKKNWLLESDIEKYRFLSNGDVQVPNVNDKEELLTTIEAMKIMALSEAEIDSVMQVISAVLLMGNLRFTQDKKNTDQAILEDDTALQKVCSLLGIPVTDVTKAFLKPRLKVGKDFVHKAQTVEQVLSAVEAITKALYERLFRWLVTRINRSLGRTTRQGTTFIGILDIAGFEIFEMNNFEQLCINYTNEKLQQLFNHTMFVREQEEYQAEGIDWDFIDFGCDLQPTIDLIEKPMGLLALLDEECVFPKATDKTLVEKFLANHSGHPKFISPDMKSKSDFGIVHYAGKVEYNADQWLTKNMDPLNDNVVSLLQKSTIEFIAGLWKDGKCQMLNSFNTKRSFSAEFASMQAESSSGGRIKKGMFRTAAQMYREQLAKLMTTLQNTSPHFVRCIVPNYEKRPGALTATLVLEQLRCNGVLEGIRICRQGYPSKVPFQEFRQRYETLLAPGAVPAGFLDSKEAVKRIVAAIELQESAYRIGTSKVFFRAGVVASLEEKRDLKLSSIVTAFQAVCKGFIARKKFQKRIVYMNAIRVVQRNGKAWQRLRDWEWWKLFLRVKPLLEVTRTDQLLATKDEELKANKESLVKREEELAEISKRLEEVQIPAVLFICLNTAKSKTLAERTKLQEQLQAESLEKVDLEEVRDQLQTRKDFLEEEVKNLSHQLEETEEKLKNRNMADLQEKLEDLTNEKEKLIQEKASLEQRLKLVTDEQSDLSENHQKIVREKIQGEERYAELKKDFEAGEEKIKQLLKTKSKLESSINELEGILSKEKTARTSGDSERKQLLNEIRELKEANEALQKQVDELTVSLRTKTEELQKSVAQVDDLNSQIQNLSKQLRQTVTELQETKDDLENEKTSRQKAERSKRDYAEELEALKQELMESQDKSQANMQLRAEREQQFSVLKKELENVTISGEQRLDEMKQKHAKEINELNDQLEQVYRQKQQSDKAKASLERELSEANAMLEQYQSARNEMERKRKTAESSISEQQSRIRDLEKEKESLTSTVTKLQSDLEQTRSTLESTESEAKAMEKKLSEASENEKDNEGKMRKLQDTCRRLEDELSELTEQHEDDETSRQKLEKELSSLKQQLADEKKKSEELLEENNEELRRKAEKELDTWKKKCEEVEENLARNEKAKKKLLQEKEDLNIELDGMKGQFREMEKKQRQFDKQIAEEKAATAKATAENDQLLQELRDRESKALVMGNEMNSLKERLEEAERVKRNLQMDLDSIMSAKEDTEKTVPELERAKRGLENELAKAKGDITELEDALQVADDARLRAEINLQQAKTDLEKALSDREEAEDEKRKNLLRKIREMEEELDSERRAKSTAIQQKKKSEAEVLRVQAESENLTRQSDELGRQLRKVGATVKELQQEIESLKSQKEAASNQTKDIEKKVRTLESEVSQLNDANSQLANAKRKVEAERDELAEELSTKPSISLEDKKRYEDRILAISEELEEERNNLELCNDKLKKAQAQIESLTSEVSAEKSAKEVMDGEKKTLERRIQELTQKLEEMETVMNGRIKSQLTALETKLQAAESDCEQETQEKNVALRQCRRLEKRLNEAAASIEEERRKTEQTKQASDRIQTRVKQLRKQIEDLEEECSRERAKTRQLQRTIDDLNETNDSLARENSQLKSSVAHSRRSGMGRSSSRYGS
uniref:Myosin motor domain-containing protein n=1 Tax=Syphacia muris TaxID=451379 RepID=A0A158R4M4_9BILA